jgi:signal transduction histidine kinase
MARQRDDDDARTRRMSINSRLLLLLAVPLIGLLAVTGFGVYSGIVQAGDAAALEQRTELARSSYRLIDSLEDERAALVADRATTDELRQAVAEDMAAVEQQAADVDAELQNRTEAALRTVAAAQSISERELGGAVALRIYSSAIEDLLDVSTEAIDPAGAIDGAPAATTDYLARAQAASAEERDLVVFLDATDALDAQSFQEVMSLASAQRSYAALAAASAPPALAIEIREVGFAMSAADIQRRDAFAGATATTTEVWVQGLTERTESLGELQQRAELDAVAAVDDLARSSRILLALAALAAVAIVLISVLLLRRARRSISRPLQELATQAEDVARVRLPEAVAAQQSPTAEQVHLPVLRATGASEVHDVAAAFNDVQDTALRLAGEQAALRVNQAEALTNLGRRNQTLLARQLDFITSLEQRETDPAFLEHLFKLDHLASRMRRNAESLLILAGSETPRRRRTPAPISEIVRAAMSEVEEFERVRIGNVRDATIAGPAVIDLIHLLAELIENALGFSPPDTTVEIDGRSLGQGGYQFAVIDHGVGMSDVELLSANQRLTGLDELEGMPTRYLGQYVVAKLAAKTGAMVRLQPSAGGRGVTALVILPSSALIGAPDRSSVAQPLPGSRASREQGPVPFAPGSGVGAGMDVGVMSTSPAGADQFGADLRDTTDPDAFAWPVPEPIEAALVDDTVLADGFADPDVDADDRWSMDDLVDPYEAPVEPADVHHPVADGDQPVGPDVSFDTDPSFDTDWAADTDRAADTYRPFDIDRSFDSDWADEPAVPADAAPLDEDPIVATDSFDPSSDVATGADTGGFTFEPVIPEVEVPDVESAHDGETDAAESDPVAADPFEVFRAPPEVASSQPADPWQQFMADDDAVTTPPPAPAAAPAQPAWLAEPAHAEHPGGTTQQPTADPATLAGATPFASTAPIAHAAPMGDAIPPAEPAPTAEPALEEAVASAGPDSRTGGLARRVPGASLAESRGGNDGAAAPPPPDRSADTVRSMLSSFQAGRDRGRVDPNEERSSTDDEVSSSTVPNAVHDGRFPQ